MSRKFLTPIDLGKNELQNAVVQNLASAPSSPVKGQLYFDSVGNVLYWWNSTSWIAAQGGASVAYGSVPAETTFGIARADGVATTVARSDHTHGSPTHDDTAHTTIHLNALAAPNGTVNMGSQLVSSVQSPSAATDAANKGYVDNLLAGLSWKESVRIGTTANVSLSGLTAIDGVTPIANDRILCKNQTAGAQNGIWLAASGAWTRALDADAVGELEQAAVFVQEGTSNADTAWVCTTNGVITPGTTATTWVQFGAGTAYVAGAGLTLTGATFDVVAADGSIVVAADSIAVGYIGTGGFYGTSATAAHGDHVHSGARSYSLPCGAGTSTVLNHNFGTRTVVVEVYRLVSPYDTVDCDVERTDINNVTVRFATAVAAGDFQIVALG